MKKKERAARIGDILDKLYPAPQIPLEHDDAFSLLVATVLSAQCTDARVNEVTPQLLGRWPGPEEMKVADIEEIKETIRSCGLYVNKSRALKGLSRDLTDKFNGEVPCSFEKLESLPGVGHKTASVVMSQAFNVPAFPVDTHIHRLACRWKLSSGKSTTVTEKDLKKVFPEQEWNRRHIQMIYFGREYCPARGHIAKECPVCSLV